jgi:hypothetical protein
MCKRHLFITARGGALWLFTVVNLSATVYLVGPQRTYTEVQEVTSRLSAGDTVFVDGNATYDGDVRFTKAGTAQRPVVVKGILVDGKRPVISGGTNTVHFNNSHHMVFEGFEVTGGSSRGIFYQADSMIIRDIVVRDCPAQGILGADIGSGSLTLEYSEVYGCGEGGSRHQIYMTTDQVNFPGSVFRMRYCYIHDANGGNNVKSRSERNEIYYNWIEGAYYHELELIGPDPWGVDDGWTVELKREDSDVVGNVLCKRRTAAGNDPDFAVTRLGGDATGWTLGRYRFVNNTIIAGSGAVFRLFDILESVEMHNNIFYRNGGGVNLYRAAEGEMEWATGEAVFGGSNNWVVNGSSRIPDEWEGTLTGADPGFVNASQDNFRLKADSPCRDAGTETLDSPEGFPFTNPLPAAQYHPPLGTSPAVDMAQERSIDETVDIGAFEYSSNPVTARPSRNIPGGISQLKVINGPGEIPTVSFVLSRTTLVKLSLYNFSGQLLKRTFQGELSVGAHLIICNQLSGNICTDGSYILELRTEDTRMAVPYFHGSF